MVLHMIRIVFLGCGTAPHAGLAIAFAIDMNNSYKITSTKQLPIPLIIMI